MASITASTVTAPAIAARRSPVSSSPVLGGLPQIGARGGRALRCSSEKSPAATQGTGAAGASLLAATGVMSVSSPVLALVDERMSTEGTGLSLGLSDNSLGWIIVGVFGLIWALYIVYASTLEEDEESGLSL